MRKLIKNIFDVSKLLWKNQISITDGLGVINEFESEFKKFVGTKYALATNNGTSALHSAYFGLNLKEGDEVIVPSYTWHATVMPLLTLGVKPIFAEINKNTLTLDPIDVEKKITKKTKAIVLVHLYGNVCDMKSFLNLKEKHNIFLIEDCSHAFSAKYNEKIVGSFGDVACFSLQGAKAVSGGEAGILVTNNREIYEKALVLGHQSRLKKELTISSLRKYEKTGAGFKYRPHPLAIVLALNSLTALKEKNTKNIEKINFLERYLSEFKDIEVVKTSDNSFRGSIDGVRVIFNGEIQNKIKFIQFLIKKGVRIREETFPLLHKQPIFGKEILLPLTEEIHKRIIHINI